MKTIRLVLLTCALGFAAAAQAANYSMTALTPAGATSSDAWDVNNLGQVVGSYSGAGFSYSRGYVWSGGAFTTLAGPAGALSTNALGVSDAGVVVGSFNNDEVFDSSTGTMVLGNQHGFILQGGAYTVIDLPGATSTVLRGISPDGRFVSGYALNASGGGRGFVLDRNTNSLAVVGGAGDFDMTIVQGINSLGQMVGDERLSSGSGPASRTSFIYDIATGTRTDQNLPGTTRTSYRDINDAGQLAGFVTLAGTIQGFVGTPAGFQTFAFGSMDNTILEGLNNAGWLVGSYAVAEGQSQAILLTPVPEPATLALWLGGLAAIGLGSRRRRT